jgi:hypothetical protein
MRDKMASALLRWLDELTASSVSAVPAA